MPFVKGQKGLGGARVEAGRRPHLDPKDAARVVGALGQILRTAAEKVARYMTEADKLRVTKQKREGKKVVSEELTAEVPAQVRMGWQILEHYTLKAGAENPETIITGGGEKVTLTQVNLVQNVQIVRPNETPRTLDCSEIPSITAKPTSTPTTPSSDTRKSSLSSSVIVRS